MTRRWLLLSLPILLLAAGVLHAEGNPWDDGRFYAGGLCAYAGVFGYRQRRISVDASYARSSAAAPSR